MLLMQLKAIQYTAVFRGSTRLLDLHAGELAIIKEPKDKKLDLEKIVDQHSYLKIVDYFFLRLEVNVFIDLEFR